MVAFSTTPPLCCLIKIFFVAKMSKISLVIFYAGPLFIYRNSFLLIRFGGILFQPTTWQVNRPFTFTFSHMTFLMKEIVFLQSGLEESSSNPLRSK